MTKARSTMTSGVLTAPSSALAGPPRGRKKNPSAPNRLGGQKQ
jgi:hypothetical protein